MKRILSLLLFALITTSTLTACYGKFALTRKIYQVNGQVQEKFLRSALTWAFLIFPVYSVAGLADFIVFNTIEFWSGNNPVASGEKDFQYVEGDKQFNVHAVKSGETVSYVIKQYDRDRYVDVLNIQWDLRTGNSTALHKESARTTEYVATKVDGAVQVQAFAKGLFDKKLEQVALYK